MRCKSAGAVGAASADLDDPGLNKWEQRAATAFRSFLITNNEIKWIIQKYSKNAMLLESVITSSIIVNHISIRL